MPKIMILDKKPLRWYNIKGLFRLWHIYARLRKDKNGRIARTSVQTSVYKH